MCGRRGRQCLLDAIDQLAIAPVGLAQFPQSLQDTLSRKIHRVAAQAGQLRGVSGRDARQGHKLEGLVRFGRDLAAHEVQQDVQQRRLERLLPNFLRRRVRIFGPVQVLQLVRLPAATDRTRKST